MKAERTGASALIIATPRTDLVLQTPEELLAWVESLPPTDRAEVSSDWLERVRVMEEGDPWRLGFVIIERTTGRPIGGCAFKGPPDAEGVVEIAYGTDPGHRGHGYATEAATGLVDFAFAHDAVRLVCAHTKPDNVGSARVLEKSGFRPVGEVTLPEDGLVRRWERTR